LTMPRMRKQPDRDDIIASLVDGAPAFNLKGGVEYAYALALSRMARAAGFALLANRIQKALPDLDLPPPDVVIRFDAEVDDYEPARFEDYCIQYCLVRMISVFEQYLRDIYLLVRIGVEARSAGQIQRDAVKQICDATVKDRSGLWKLFRNLFTALGKPVKVIEGRHWISSLDGIRNCIVHRGGWVEDLDVGKKGVFEAVWRKTTMMDPGGRFVTSLPHKVEKGGELSVIFADEKRVWNKGERIALSVQDCQDGAFTLSAVCYQIHINVSDGLRQLLAKRT